MEPTDDPQLCKLLREWQVEDAPPALDARVLGTRKTWRRLLAIALLRKPLLVAGTVAMGAFLMVVTQAIPQTLKLVSPQVPIPYTVDSEYVRYGDDGAPRVDMYSTSYANQNGGEVILGRTIAAHPLETAAGRTLDSILTGLGSTKQAKQSAPVPHTVVGVVSGCSDWSCLTLEHWYFRIAGDASGAPCTVGPVVGHETILGYPTIAIERPLPNPRATPNRPAASRITMWMAPDLGCFALRISIKDQQPDGTFRAVKGKEALKVTLH